MLAQFGQSTTGELRFTVTDAGGLPVQCAVELISDANQVHEQFQTDSQGVVAAKRLPFGTYRVVVMRDGFSPFSGVVEVRSAVPIDYRVTLSVAPIDAQVTVRADATFLDLHQTATVHNIGADTLEHRAAALPGRALPDLTNTQPGWLLEANGVLHPRGSEYQTQYVIDGLPLTDNRSPATAPEIDTDDVHAISILTGGYPAEYGRKLGGIIEIATAREARHGFHGALALSAGSFRTRGGNASGAYGWQRTTLGASGGVAVTDRYLDPPVEANDTNHGKTSNISVHFERELTAADRLSVIARHGQSHFLVPNEHVQQAAGQQQTRESRETAGQFSYDHFFAGRVFNLRGMVRDLSAGLESNDASTPIVAQQDRGFREVYLKGALSGHHGAHEWKVGGDASLGTVRERFGYRVTDVSQFDPDTPPVFRFDDRRADREYALFAQDEIRVGRWTATTGVRWDRYQLVVNESAVSPRLGIAWSWPAANLVMRASYDRAFQTPAFENLLLASSLAVDTLNDNVIRLPVRPSLGNFYEAGFSKALFGVARLDASYFERIVNNFADDDLLLNAGISFPIAFRRADIKGTELKLDIPHWQSLSGFVSYALMHGVGRLPITGGLFLGDEASALLGSTDRFAVTQDQRHTVRSRVGYQISPAAWVAFATSYGSGLPFEFDGDPEQAVAQYGRRIVDRVNFGTGRVRPSFSLDVSAGAMISTNPKHRLHVQADIRNLTSQLNVIDFAGLFSGTALAPPRSVTVRLRAEF
jgi:outer membrane cobalamin receptor